MLFIGTSSYSFKEWVGKFYPPQTPPSKYLAYYSLKLSTVEINYTFRHFPTEKLAETWAKQTPDEFQFSFKMHQSLTHRARLRNVESALKDFLSNLGPLGPRLGVILVQLPPTFGADLARLEEFLSLLPSKHKFAFEFRHPSWNRVETTDLLKKAGVALCVSQNEIRESLPLPTASYSYVRVRKPPPYSGQEMTFLQRQIRELTVGANDVYFYIKHEDRALAPLVAAELSTYPS